jgi:hypothetical protein
LVLFFFLVLLFFFFMGLSKQVRRVSLSLCGPTGRGPYFGGVAVFTVCYIVWCFLLPFKTSFLIFGDISGDIFGDKREPAQSKT